MRACALAVILCLVTTPATGQAPSPLDVGQQAPAPRGRSPQSALTIGLAATLIPATAGMFMWSANRDPSEAALVIAGGVILGPAIGYWSAGMSGRGWKSLALRAGLALGSLASGMAICGWSCTVGDANYDLAWAGVATGSGLGALSAWYDLARVKPNVREHNDRQATQRIAFTPTYVPRSRTWGLRVGVMF